MIGTLGYSVGAPSHDVWAAYVTVCLHEACVYVCVCTWYVENYPSLWYAFVRVCSCVCSVDVCVAECLCVCLCAATCLPTIYNNG